MELSKFVDEELYPAIFRSLDKVFPSMKFERFGTKWRSPFNIDGTSPKHKRKDKTVVTQSKYQVAIENGEGGSKNLISLYMELEGEGDRIEAIKKISGIVGILHLFPERENAQESEETWKEREQLALSLDRQRRALFDSSNQAAKELLQYLTEKRGYSLELIRTMGIGYISPEEAQFLKEKCNIKINWKVEDFPLSIAYFSNGHVIGFKCRYITAEAQEKYGKSKYRNAFQERVDMNKAPFGIFPNNLSNIKKKEQVIVMEGELDALHATVLGLPNVIATSGSQIVAEQAEAIRKNGYKNVVIVLDTDGAGQKYTWESIQNIDGAGLNSFTATLPEGKDTDEYLQSHTIEELKGVIDRAQFGGLFLYLKERDKFYQGSQTEIEFFNFLEEYYKIASRYDPTKREILLTYLRNDFPEANIESIEKGIKEKVELLAAAEEKKRKRVAAEADLRQATSLLASGEAMKAAEKTQKALDSLKESERDTEYSFLLEDNTEALWRQYKENQVGLSTNIEIYHREGTELVPYEFFFPSGAISVIGAPTNHGKSKVLQSIALDNLGSLEEGETLLYITYEENELNVNKQFLNAYANLILTAKGKKGSNLKSITEYLCEGKDTFIRAEALAAFKEKEEEWKDIRHSRKIKIVKPEDNYLETLLGLIDFATSHLRIKAIFIDYVQEIYVREWSKYSRTDELKEAMVRLDATAQRTNIPIIMAAQLKRETNSPLDLYNQYIADSGWIERKASEIILIWSNKETCKGEGTDKTLKRIDEEIEKDLGEKLELGRGGKLYLKLTKSRVFPSGSHAIVPINGNTGRVGDTTKKKRGATQTNLPIFDTIAPGQSTTYDDNVVSDPEAQKPRRKEKDIEEEDGLPFPKYEPTK